MSGLNAFFEILDAYKKTLAWALGSSAILPLIASFSGLAPTWPPAIALLTSLFSLIFIILSFQLFRRVPKKRVSRAMVFSLVLAVAFLPFYLFFFDRFTFVIPTTGETIYVGCGWSDHAKEISDVYLFDSNSGCPGDYSRVLASAQYESETVWRKSGLTAVKLTISLLWLAFFAAIATFVGTFLVHQYDRK